MPISMIIAMAIAAAAPEPVVWTKMADPEPDFVAPKQAARTDASPPHMESEIKNQMRVEREADSIKRDYERQVRALEQQIERTLRTIQEAEAQAKAPQR